MKQKIWTAIQIGYNKPILIGTGNSIVFLSFSNRKKYRCKVDTELEYSGVGAHLNLNLKGERVKIMVLKKEKDLLTLKVWADTKLLISTLCIASEVP